MKKLSKTYEPQLYEDKIYKCWEASGFFNPDVCVEKGVCEENAKHFSIVLPPPNVTGTLHIGHAMMLVIQDLMIRYHRMKGDKTLWLPGTDHAAIATQTKVEKLLMEKGIKEPKKELGKEKFLEAVNKFAQASHDTIVNQCKKMGSSLDWSREAFTLDEERNLAVRTVFKKMYDDGLTYRGYRIVNWCPHCQSTIADDEVEYKEQRAKFYTFKYSVDFPITISTTRPETKLGDTAIAVNPKDKRYKKYIGQEFAIKNFAGGPDLKIKIIADENVEREFGTGALGVTPAHSLTDYEMAQKNGLPIIKIIDEAGKMTSAVGANYEGLTVKEARKKVIENLQDNNLLEKEEEINNNLSICYRCGTPIEPIPSRQWFIEVNKKFKIGDCKLKNIKKGQTVTLKKLMQEVVKSKQIEIIPERFNKIYFHWIDNLRDWCISRQLWYGHQIPVYYCKQGFSNNQLSISNCKEPIVSVEKIFKCPHCGGEVEQDPDTLDTWFSSGLWTFSTLGYPDLNASDLKNYHPTSVMETGYDILFFWVARMILMTTYVLGVIPFEKVYLHGLVRDEQGRKMSKSLGNVIDPLDVCKKYGTDAVRLSLLLGNSPGNDCKLSEEKIAGFRNFSNKLWNMSRFMSLQISNFKIQNDRIPETKTLADQYILLKLNSTIDVVCRLIESFQFSQAGEILRDFTWTELADWYLEIAKIEGNKSEILNYILNTILKLWHPFMPFVTEQIWTEIYSEEKMLMIEKFPQKQNISVHSEVLEDFYIIKNIITGIRSLRAENKIEPAKKLNVSISAGDKVNLLKVNIEIIKGLARVEELNISKKAEKTKTAIGFVESGVEVFVDLFGAIDIEAEKVRLQKEIANVEPYVIGLEKKLNNIEFVNNAPEKVVMIEKKKLVEAQEKLIKLKSQLNSLK